MISGLATLKSMNISDQSVSVTLMLPRSLYQKATQTAEKEQRSLEDLLKLLVAEGLTARTTVRQVLESISIQYCQRLARDGQAQQSPEQVLQNLKQVREQIADELYPD
jgi:selenocysteine-specific translation elongation factor